MELISLAEAAKEADRSISTLHRWIHERRLIEGVDYYKVGDSAMVVINAPNYRKKLRELSMLLETRGAGGRPRKPRK